MHFMRPSVIAGRLTPIYEKENLMTFESQDANPYSPPTSEIKDKKIEKGSPKKSVIVACSIDLIGTFFISAILGFLYGLILASQGFSQEEIINSYISQRIFSPLNLVFIFCGTSITAYAGYMCAKIGKCNNYKLITTYLIIVVVLINIFNAIGGVDISTIKNIILSTVTILAGYFGGWIYIRNN